MTECARQVRHGGIHADDKVQLMNGRGGVRKIAQPLVQIVHL